MATSARFELNSFRFTIEDIANIELEKLHALSVMVGWPHRPEDWLMLLETGHGVAAMDEIGRVLGTAMWFPFGTNFATVGMVITSPRLQARGAGRRMMEHVLAQAGSGSRALGLNATRAARRLYLSLGFTIERTVYQYQGMAAMPAPAPPLAGATLRSIEPADLTELAALDHRAYGANRSALLARLLDISQGVALLRRGRIRAFALCRRFGRGHVVGPVVAETDDDAVAVTRPHVADHAGRFLRLDTRQQEGAFPEFLARSRLPIYNTVTSMSRGRPWVAANGNPTEKQPTIYALVNQAVG